MLNRIKSGALIAVAILLASSVAPAGAQTQLTVVELFTSQGCSSCPPADKLLGGLTKRDDVIALSFNVDYWDYLGWKDTLASPANTDRQRSYASSLGRRSVYTPQIVVDGRYDAVGSDASGVERAIRRAAAARGERAQITLDRQGDKIMVQIDGKPPKTDATIWLVRFDRTHTIPIRRGENSGRSITYYNVVRDYHSLGLWRGGPMEIALSREALMEGGRDGCAVIVQQHRFGPIVGAANLNLQ